MREVVVHGVRIDLPAGIHGEEMRDVAMAGFDLVVVLGPFLRSIFGPDEPNAEPQIGTGSAHTAPSEKPAAWISKARLKRARLFSQAIVETSSTNCFSFK